MTATRAYRMDHSRWDNSRPMPGQRVGSQRGGSWQGGLQKDREEKKGEVDCNTMLMSWLPSGLGQGCWPKLGGAGHPLPAGVQDAGLYIPKEIPVRA